MANDRLRQAMEVGQIDVESLAEEASVDQKTVRRWLAGTVTPHPRHRFKVADIVGVPSHVLWPRADAPPAGTDATDEIVAAWPHRAVAPIERWTTLLERASHQVHLLGYAIQFLPEQHPGFTETLTRKAERGCSIRVALGDPDSDHVAYRDKEEGLDGDMPSRIKTTLRHLRPLDGHKGIEVRLHSSPLYNSVFRFDEDMLVTPHTYGMPGYRAPLLHLHRLSTDGLFDAWASHFDRLWTAAYDVDWK